MFKNKILKNNKIINFLLFSILLIFCSKVLFNLLNHGSDFDIPYTLSKLFYQKIDIFEDISRNPLYPHSLYILFGPFTLFGLEVAKIIFFVINIILLLFTIFYLKKVFKLDINQTKIVILISFTATPFTNLLAIGNLSIIVLFCLICYYYSKSKLFKSLFLLVSFFKYNVSFIFILYAFINKEYKVLFYFALLNLFFALCYYFYLDIYSFERIFDPFFLAFELIQGRGEVNNIGKSFFTLQSILVNFGLNNLYPVIFAISLVLIFFIFKNLKIENHTKLVSLFLLSTVLVYHGMYEFVILLPFVAYVLKNREYISYVSLHSCTIFFIFYFFKINKVIFNNFVNNDIMSIIGFILLISSLIILIKINSKEMLKINRDD